jgi:anti-anti-sigma factor
MEGEAQIEIETVGDVSVVSLIGDFDMGNADELERHLRRIAASGGAVVVSLVQTDFLDSRGVKALYCANTTLNGRGRQLVLHVNTASIVHRMLEISGLASTVPCTGSLEDAVSIATRGG